MTDDERDAKRYRWLRDTLTTAVCGGVYVNDERAYYREPDPGKAVEIRWYPITPIGFVLVEAATFDEAVDEAMKSGPPIPNSYPSGIR